MCWSSPLAPLDRWLENVDDVTDMGREMTTPDTRLEWCECEPLLPSTGELKKLDHGLFPTRLLSERRLVCPRLQFGLPTGGGMLPGAPFGQVLNVWAL